MRLHSRVQSMMDSGGRKYGCILGGRKCGCILGAESVVVFGGGFYGRFWGRKCGCILGGKKCG